VAFEDAEGADQLIGVVAAGGHAGEVGVAQQVVHAVGVEVRTADQLAQYGIRRKRIAQDQREHLLGIDADAVEAGLDLGQREDLLGAQLVAAFENRLAGVAERTVTHVVQQQARA